MNKIRKLMLHSGFIEIHERTRKKTVARRGRKDRKEYYLIMKGVELMKENRRAKHC